MLLTVAGRVVGLVTLCTSLVAAQSWTGSTPSPYPTQSGTRSTSGPYPTQSWRGSTPGPYPTSDWGTSTTVQIPTTIANLFEGCESVKDLTGAPGQIRSPNYPSNYDNNTECSYRITVGQGKIAAIRFDDMSIEGQEGSNEDCKYDYIEIHDGPEETTKPILRACGNLYGFEPHRAIRGRGNQLFVKFVSDGTVAFRGFQITYLEESSPCGGQLVGSTGGWITTIKPNDKWSYQPYNYPPFTECVWTITVEQDLQILLEFDEFEFEKCPDHDFLEISDGSVRKETDQSTRRLCGTELPASYESTGNSLFLYMATDSSREFRGFRAHYKALLKTPNCGEALTSESGSIRYPTRGNYAPDQHCEWTITVTPGKHLVITITDLDLGESLDCEDVFLEIRNGGYLGSNLLWKSCRDPHNVPDLVSDSHKVYIRFRSGSTTGHSGFALDYRSENGCGSNLTAPHGVIQSPDYPMSFPANLNCTWNLTVPQGQTIRLNVKAMDLPQAHWPHKPPEYPHFHDDIEHWGLRCEDTYLQVGSVFHGEPTRLCGSWNARPIDIMGNFAWLQFVSSANSTQGRGFQVTYELGCRTRLHGERGTLSSPNFPNAYGTESDCQWSVTIGRSSPVITINIIYLALTDCETQKLQVLGPSYYNETVYADVCEPTANPLEIRVYTDKFNIMYESGPTVHDEGFQLSWQYDRCSFNLTKAQDTFQSPGYPHNMPVIDNCEWHINPGFGREITLTFTDLTDLHCDNSPIHVTYYKDNEYHRELVCADNATFMADSGLVVSVQNPHYRWAPARFLANYVTECGGVLNANISSKLGSPSNQQYTVPQNCAWTLKTDDPSKHVFLNIRFLNISESPNCEMGSLTVRTGSASTDHHVMCGTERPTYAEVPLSGPEVNVIFNVNDGSVGTGFFATYYVDEPSCDDILFDQSGSIASPNYPYNYPRGKSCLWRIVASPGERVRLTIHDIDMDSSYSYCRDFLSLSEPNTFNQPSELPANLCTGQAGEDLVFTTVSNEMWVRFFSRSTGNNGYRGFTARYEIVDGCGGALSGPSGAFSLPSELSNHIFCHWTIEVAEGKAIELNIQDYDNTHTVCGQGLRIYSGSNNRLLSPYCRQDSFPRMVRWKGNELTVVYSGIHASTSRFSATFAQRDMSQLCGGSFGTESGIFTSAPSTECEGMDSNEYLVTVPVGMQVKFSLSTQGVYHYFSFSGHCPQKIQIFDGASADTDALLSESCHGHTYMSHVISSSNQLLLKTSDGHVDFVANFEQVCHHNITDSRGTIMSPNFPNNYPVGLNCTWSINSNMQGYKIELTFESFDMGIPADGSCNSFSSSTDMVELFDSVSMSRTNRVARLCPSDPFPTTYVSSGDGLHVKMTSLPSSPGAAGFKARYRSLCHSRVFSSSYSRTLNSYTASPSTNSGPFNCSWTISSSRTERIVEIRFQTVDIPSNSSCVIDYIEIRNGDEIQRYCDSNIPTITSSGRNITVTLHKGSDNTRSSFRLQHQERYRPCGGTLTGSSGSLQSENYPSPYPNQHTCEWHIRAPEGHTISLQFETFNLEYHIACIWDSVSIFDGANTPSNRIGGLLCGSKSQIPSDFTSTGNFMTVYFSTDSSVTSHGFLASYTIASSQECREELTETSGTVSVQSSAECYWLITVAQGLVIDLDTSMYPNPEHTCHGQQGLQVFDGEITAAHRLTPSCHNQLFPERIVSSSNRLLIHYDGLTMGQDFTIHYTTLAVADMCDEAFSEISGVFTSPAVGTVCLDPQWHITLPEGTRVLLNVLSVSGSLVDHLLRPTVQIYDGPDNTATQVDMISFASNGLRPWLSTSNQILITQTGGTVIGTFTALYNASCVHNLTGRTGNLSSPGYPVGYPNNIHCEWVIIPPRDLSIDLTFTSVDLDNCPRDRIRLKNPHGSWITVCDVPGGNRDFLTHNTPISVQFTTDGSGTANGFSATYTTSCNGNFSAMTTRQFIQSPNYPLPYYDNLNCTWTLVAPSPNRRVSLIFEHFDLPSGDCSSDYVQVTQENGTTQNYCGYSTPRELTSTGRTMRVRFHSDSQPGMYSGFVAYYQLVSSASCRGNLTAPSGTVMSPNHPHNYDNNQNCSWTIIAPPTQQVTLTFTAFRLESHSRCLFDVVKVYDGPSSRDSSTELTPANGLCGTGGQANYVSIGRYMTVTFTSDYSVTEEGFSADYTTS